MIKPFMVLVGLALFVVAGVVVYDQWVTQTESSKKRFPHSRAMTALRTIDLYKIPETNGGHFPRLLSEQEISETLARIDGDFYFFNSITPVRKDEDRYNDRMNELRDFVATSMPVIIEYKTFYAGLFTSSTTTLTGKLPDEDFIIMQVYDPTNGSTSSGSFAIHYKEE